MSESVQESSSELNLKSLPVQIIERLAELYVHWGLGETEDDFYNDVAIPLNNDSSQSGPFLQDQLDEIAAKRQATKTDFLKVSCAYCYDSMRADRDNYTEWAWIFASFAHYWLGMANGAALIPGAVGSVRSLTASGGGSARAQKKWGELKKWVLAQAKKGIEEGKFKEAAQAATILSRQLDRDYQTIEPDWEEKGLHLAPTKKAVRGWLEEVEFPTKDAEKTKRLKM